MFFFVFFVVVFFFNDTATTEIYTLSLHDALPIYEFPGGKLEIGESRQQALIREIKEELDYAIQVEREFLTVEHQYPDFRLLMHSYLCTAKDVNFTLIEHIDYKWLTANQLERLDWAAADRAIVKQLVSQKNINRV